MMRYCRDNKENLKLPRLWKKTFLLATNFFGAIGRRAEAGNNEASGEGQHYLAHE
jgi:hypothetical protein